MQDLEETFASIERFLSAIPNVLTRISPAIEDVFKSLELTPESVKVVIVGQDPYPNRKQAMGRAFAVPSGTSPIPGSLKNIFREKMDDFGGDAPRTDLLEWQDQGVMLINTVFTTLEGQSDAHSKIGWQTVSSRILQTLSENGATAILWGNAARGFEPFFENRVITGVHPSPLSAHRGFFGSKPFTKVNALLDEPIQW